jgi:hypothetical protein
MLSASLFTTSAVDGSATVTLSDGTRVGFPAPRSAEPTAQDIRNVLRGILELIENLDKRVAALQVGRAAAPSGD